MNPVSQPIVQASPDQISFGVDSLALFQTYTRESYRAAFGIEAPLWDPSRRGKTWFDSTVNTSIASGATTYKIVARDDNGQWSLRTMSLPAAEAASVNLPGAITYPNYAIQPTGASRGGSLINPLYLSLESEARALMAVLDAGGIVDQGATAVFPVIYPPDEPRRMWAVVRSGQQYNAGGLLAMRNAAGVGAPGSWQSAQGHPVWVADPPAPTGFDDTRPAVDMPVRDLFSNEELRPGLMGFGVLVYRTDLELEQAKLSGAFTQDDRAKLDEIYRVVSKLGV